MIQHREELNKYIAERGALELPEDFTTDIPPVGRAWLLRGGVNSYLTDHYGIGWSEKMARVVIPVRRDGALVAVQARAVLPNQKPKYLNKSGMKTALFWSDPAIMLNEPVLSGVVLTEDILSTIRVGRVTQAAATLGTYLSPRVVSVDIAPVAQEAHLWYDGDEAGVKGARKAKRALELQGLEVRRINTDHDPKDYSNAEIIEILKS